MSERPSPPRVVHSIDTYRLFRNPVVIVRALVCHMVVRKCLLLMMLSPGSSFVLMPKNATGRVAGDLTLLNRHAYRWDMPEARPPLSS